MEELEKTFSFGKKTGYNATEDLLRTRSSKYQRNTLIRCYSTWSRPAPDLRMQLYHPQPVPRNSQQATQPWKYKASFDYEPSIRSVSYTCHTCDVTTFKPGLDQRSKSEVQMIPSMREAIFGAEEKEKDIVVSPRVLRPWEAQILFVKEGMLPKGKYFNPKPHDHRGYPPVQSLGLPEFGTTYERDPYNIKFKRKNLDQIYGLPRSIRDILPGKQLGDDVLKQPPKWEQKLHLPRGSFPTKAQQTTRHRPLDRSPHSAFMERVEHKLSRQWENERAIIQSAPDIVEQT